MGDRRRIAAFLNALPPDAARAALTRCCGSRRWVEAMLAARPFPNDAALRDTADRAWWALDRRAWLEAFAHHPRIGEPGRGDAWARGEQAGADAVEAAVRRELAAGNLAYERRFGYVFLIRATGRGGAELLAELRRRLGNDPAEELRTAAGEQAQITWLRLEKLVTP
ncbi:MAG: 2-oxo-4-hydroxy-4-carboxy-5-ureidoimidazoline decarboxylase [Gemmatimonadales bacterium]